MTINVHAGHNPDGKIACGAVGLIKESTENRRMKELVIGYLRQLGHTVYDCTVDDGASQSDVLKKIVAKCNAHTVDLDVSIHFNAAAYDPSGDGRTTGTEVYVYKLGNTASGYAAKICAAIAALGFKNRGVQAHPNLYVLRHTNAPALLVECCFVDDADDVKLYNRDPDAMARAIVTGITGQTIPAAQTAPASGSIYRVQVGAFASKANAEAMLGELKKAGFEGYITSA